MMLLGMSRWHNYLAESFVECGEWCPDALAWIKSLTKKEAEREVRALLLKSDRENIWYVQ